MKALCWHGHGDIRVDWAARSLVFSLSRGVDLKISCVNGFGSNPLDPDWRRLGSWP
jgi:hypothetical protein